MDGPRGMLRRAAENRRTAPVRPAMPEAESRVSAEPPRPQAREHHGDYEALMRSHDRLRTRHLPVQGGQNRA